jgi:hypothetical protein
MSLATAAGPGQGQPSLRLFREGHGSPVSTLKSLFCNRILTPALWPEVIKGKVSKRAKIAILFKTIPPFLIRLALCAAARHHPAEVRFPGRKQRMDKAGPLADRANRVRRVSFRLSA